jgi:hypothetical protein
MKHRWVVWSPSKKAWVDSDWDGTTEPPMTLRDANEEEKQHGDFYAGYCRAEAEAKGELLNKKARAKT